MKSILSILLRRELLPAAEGKGLKQWLTYRLVITVLPTLGIFCFIALGVLGSLGLMAVHEKVAQQLESFKTSPYHAIFARGRFFTEEQRLNHEQRHHHLSHWKKLTPKEIQTGELVQTQELVESPIFRDIYPFSWIYLEIQDRNKDQYPDQQGLALHFTGAHADLGLLGEIESHFEAPARQALETQEEGIILSRKMLTFLGYEQAPASLQLRYRYNKMAIPIPIIAIADQLPYQLDYVIPMELWHRLESNWYDHPVSDIEIKSAHQEMPKALTERFEVDSPFQEGDAYIHTLYLKSLTRAEILRALDPWRQQFTSIDLGILNAQAPHSYSGGIFHLNYGLIDQLKERANPFLLALNEQFKQREIQVHGSFMHSLLSHLDNRALLVKMRVVLIALFTALILLQWIFFALLLHTRMHRIGVIRMLGVSDPFLMGLYLIKGFLLWLVALGLGVFVLENTGLSLTMIPWHGLALTLLIAELGFMIPILVFLRTLSPLEMITYRS